MKGMRTFADITDRGKQAIEAKDYGALADLMVGLFYQFVPTQLLGVG